MGLQKIIQKKTVTNQLAMNINISYQMEKLRKNIKKNAKLVKCVAETVQKDSVAMTIQCI